MPETPSCPPPTCSRLRRRPTPGRGDSPGFSPNGGDDVPLLHRVRIAELDACLPAGLLAELLRRVVGDAEKGATAIAGLRAGSDGLAAAAHKLRGAAGNLGLARVAAIAAEIEAAAREDREAAGAAQRLAAAVAATRAALARPGSSRSGLSASSGRTGAEPAGPLGGLGRELAEARS